MRERARQVDETRRRIVEAAVYLHGSVGPRDTTVAAIAQRAGVTRLTVYRHFSDETSLFEACSGHWLAQQRLPDPTAWTCITDPEERLRAGLTDVYGFYRRGESMLSRIYRDEAWLPDAQRRASRRREWRWRDILLAPFDRDGASHRRAKALLGHALSFSTWQSLHANRLPQQDAVDAMVGLVLGATRPPTST
jgi:AcrR family transcriptional regulator